MKPPADGDFPHGSALSAQGSGGIALPVRELEYDDRVDYAADVSVMESLGGPSLLVERARLDRAAGAGADRASFEDLDRQDPELAELVRGHGGNFVPDPGCSREESAFRDPYRFYEHAVSELLREHEPEKVRLLGKLMAKYRGRERHLIHKLGARYSSKAPGASKSASGEAADGSGQAVPAPSRSRSGDNLGKNGPTPSQMERIGEEEGDEAGSSVLNDPSRANVAAIESARKRMEVDGDGDGGAASAAKGKSASPRGPSAANEEGWPPAMSDPWGTGGASSAEKGASREITEARSGADGDARQSSPRRTPRDLDETDDGGSYSGSEGSSYSGSDGIDGTSPAIIAQVSELLNFVYGKTSVAGQIDRVSTIMRAYEGREAVLLELLETKALIKANADSSASGDLPASLRNNAGLNSNRSQEDGDNGGEGGAEPREGAPSSDRKVPPTPVSVLTTPTLPANGPASPATVASPRSPRSPSNATFSTANSSSTTASKKKKFFGFSFGSSKNSSKSKDKVSSGVRVSSKAPARPGGGKGKKGKSKKSSKKGQQLTDDGSI